MTRDEMKEKQRLFWIDCIRVIASFLVVIQHSISQAWISLGTSAPQSTEWMIMNAVFMLSRMAVPIFFLCSGAMMLERSPTLGKIWKHNIPRIMVPYAFWMSIYGIRDVVHMMITGERASGLLVNAFLKKILFGHFHTWFIMALLGLYMVTPLISPALQELCVLAYAAMLSVFLTCVWPIIETLDPVGRMKTLYDNLGLQILAGFLLYYVAGRLLMVISYSRKRGIGAALIVIGCMFAAWWMSCAGTVTAGVVSQDAYTPLSFLGVLIACGLFYVARGIPEPDPNGLLVRGVRFFGGIGMGVYLIHPLFHEAIIVHFQGLSSVIAGILVWLISVGICLPFYFNKWARKMLFGIS